MSKRIILFYFSLETIYESFKGTPKEWRTLRKMMLLVKPVISPSTDCLIACLGAIIPSSMIDLVDLYHAVQFFPRTDKIFNREEQLTFEDF